MACSASSVSPRGAARRLRALAGGVTLVALAAAGNGAAPARAAAGGDVVTSTLPGGSTVAPGDVVVDTQAQRRRSETALIEALKAQKAIDEAASPTPPPTTVYVGSPCPPGVPCPAGYGASQPMPQPRPILRSTH